MTNTLIAAYLGFGLAAARPATPSIDAGAIAFYYATDTATLTQWSGSAWISAGGYAPGSPPTIVQVGHNQNGNDAITLGSAPVNGNLLVAMWFNPSVSSAGSGWTIQATNASGTDFGIIATKVAGAGESTTQQPMASTSSPGAMIIWELHGQNATPILGISTQAEQSGTNNASGGLPNVSGAIFLGACALVSTSFNNSKLVNVTQDVLDVTGSTRQLAAGHSTLATAPLGQILVNFTGSGSSKALGVLITS